jgi:GST-like protein
MARPIDLYYWPTPSGWKVTIFLEEAGMPYNVLPVDLAVGNQFESRFLKLSQFY